jgi:hypothetical protein
MHRRIFFLFGVIGLSIFSGSLHKRCVYDADSGPQAPTSPPGLAPPTAPPSPPPFGALSNTSLAPASSNWQLVPDLEETPCSTGSAAGAFHCPADYGGSGACRGELSAALPCGLPCGAAMHACGCTAWGEGGGVLETCAWCCPCRRGVSRRLRQPPGLLPGLRVRAGADSVSCGRPTASEAPIRTSCCGTGLHGGRVGVWLWTGDLPPAERVPSLPAQQLRLCQPQHLRRPHPGLVVGREDSVAMGLGRCSGVTCEAACIRVHGGEWHCRPRPVPPRNELQLYPQWDAQGPGLPMAFFYSLVGGSALQRIPPRALSHMRGMLCQLRTCSPSAPARRLALVPRHDSCPLRRRAAVR